MRFIVPSILGFAALAVAQSTDCVSKFETCLLTKPENECSSENASCKDLCSKDLDSCNKDGKTDSGTCQTTYMNCLNTFPTLPYGDCVHKFSSCIANGNTAATCNSLNTVCKTSCTVINDDCLVSGTADKPKCQSYYTNCLVSYTPLAAASCVSRYDTCLSTNKSVATCNMENADCKDGATTIQDTCLTSGDNNQAQCSTLYNSVLYNGTALTRPTCSDQKSACKADKSNTDSDCDRIEADCKDTCTNIESTCRSSQNPDTEACISLRYQCLGSSSAASASTVSAGMKVVPTGSFANGTVAGSNVTATHAPVPYTGAASKAGFAGFAGVAGVFAVFAYFL